MLHPGYAERENSREKKKADRYTEALPTEIAET